MDFAKLTSRATTFLKSNPKYDPYPTYVDGIVTLLTPEFNLDAHTQDLLRSSLLSYLAEKNHITGVDFEFILDDPGSANWRLKSNGRYEHPGFHLADYRGGDRRSERELRINQSLITLSRA